MRPWYKVVTLRREVREGRSYSPDEFAIALEQVVAGTAPADYVDPFQFFSRTCFTRALVDHSGMVLRRLAGQTGNTAPVLTLLSQFGGGKTHTLTSLYHLANSGKQAGAFPGVTDLLDKAGLAHAPAARIAVFVGSAWDPSEGRETPWLDLARQLGGDVGVTALGPAARTTPPGTDALTRMFSTANGPILLLFDEVLNFVNRHRRMADHFLAFIQNLTVAVTGRTRAAAVISLPRSQMEMTDWDEQWQQRITKVVRRVARDLIANDESEISEVVRRRLFEDVGTVRTRRAIARGYSDWCFERSARLPPEWLAVDSATTEAKARDYLRNRFEACYPFHPATLSVFQRKWRALPQFQQTRGALAMLAQWVSLAARSGFKKARKEPLITLGSAPLESTDFRPVVLGQLGEHRLDTAIQADLSGSMSHARALDADATGALRDIHRRVGTSVFFECSGGQLDKVARFPELRFALGEPQVDTASIDTAARALEASAFFIRMVGADGYRIHHTATLKKVVGDRKASLDEEADIKPAVRKLVAREFKRGATLPAVVFPEDSTNVPDSTRLLLVVLDPDMESTSGETSQRIGRWTRNRGGSPRLYPGSLVWCVRGPGRGLHNNVATWLAWQRVALDVDQGILGADYDPGDRAQVAARTKEAEMAAKDEVWGGYRFVVLADTTKEDRLNTIDLGPGHASGSDTLCARVVTALKSSDLLNESVGAGYIDRHWPPAFRETGAWPLAGLRQSFLTGSLTRLVEPEKVLRRQILVFVERGDFGLGSRETEDGFHHFWYKESVPSEEVVFEPDVFLVTKAKAEKLTQTPPLPPPVGPPNPPPVYPPNPPIAPPGPPPKSNDPVALSIVSKVPPETWNRIGIKLLPKLRSVGTLDAAVEFSVNDVRSDRALELEAEVRRILKELDLRAKVTVARSGEDL